MNIFKKTILFDSKKVLLLRVRVIPRVMAMKKYSGAPEPEPY